MIGYFVIVLGFVVKVVVMVFWLMLLIVNVYLVIVGNIGVVIM